MYINTFQYRAEHLNCNLCAQFKHRRCTAKRCPWLVEHVEAAAAGFQAAIMEIIPCDPHSETRQHTAVRRFSGSLYLTAAHRQRMKKLQTRMGRRRCRDTPAYYAAMYLLTANEDLYRCAANCFCRGGIEFDCAALRDISPHDYTLFSAARDIYADSSGIMLADLSNSVVVDTLAFSLIVNALLIARYGSAVLDIREGGGSA